MEQERLPIEVFKAEIMKNDASYIIVEAETGSGKSTMVPQWYRELGLKVLVTEPLIETVIGTSEYVAELAGVSLGNEVGYRTASNRNDSPNSEILFCTDGLALVRELAGHNRFDILIIDELHEWNTNQSTLEAWAWKHLQAGDSPFQKIVVLSATLDSNELSRKRGNAPVFKVPGRQFPITDRQAGFSLIADIKALVAEGYDVLCFQPGKKEIADTIDGLSGIDAELIPFHGQLERSEKNKAFGAYNRPKVVVSTNALETGRTLVPSPGRKLAVVDSGMERRVELVDGIEGLYLKPIAKARAMQRRGRTGRMGEGLYIDHCQTSQRSDYPIPEILRTRLDQTVLRLAVAGYDATELPFFHDLDNETIVEAKRALRALGAMSDDGTVTKTGRLMAKLPVSVQYARMIVEAEKKGVVDDVLTIASILEAGEISDRTGKWRAYTNETESDLMAQLDIWNVARGKRNGELQDMGIFAKSYYRAKDIRSKLVSALRAHRVRFGSSGNRMDILKACVAGMVDHLYRSTGGGDYRNGGNGDRRLDRSSVVTGNPDWIVGLPKDIEFKNRKGRLCRMALVTMATAVDPRWLAEVAPQLVSEEYGLSPRYDSEKDSVVSTTRIYFQGQLIREETVADPKHPEAEKVFISALAGGRVSEAEEILEQNRQVRKTSEDLQVRSGGEAPAISEADERAQYELALEGRGIVSATSLAEAIQSGRVNPNDLLLKPEDFISAQEQERIKAENPDSVEVDGEILPVEYGRSFSNFYVRTEISEEFARSAQAEGVTLPGGRSVEIRCSGHSAITFHGLVAKLEKSRIDQAWRERRSELEDRFWVYEPEKILLRLGELLSEAEITRTDNGAGEPVTGFVSLFFAVDTNPKFRIRISENREEAEEETRKGLGRLLSAAAGDILAVPQEEPWQSNSTGMFSRWSLTEPGQALQNRFETLVSEYAEGLTPQNFEERLEALKAAAERAKAEIGGEHEDARRNLEETESEIEGKIETLEDRNFVESEIGEIRELLGNAKKKISAGAYGDVRANCEQVREVWKQAEGKIADRQARVDRGEILVNFEVGHRRGGVTGNGTGWVIRPDGSLRDPDKRDLRRNGDGTLVWNLVNEDELALQWSCGTTRDIAGSSEFVVAKMPVGGLTETQREAVFRIETEDIGIVPNSFGLDPEAAERQARAVAELADTFSVCPACGEKLVIDQGAYRAVVGQYGFHICEDDEKISRLVDWNRPFERSTEGRDAQVVASRRISTGMIEVLAYEKWGGWNLNLRWREMTAEEAAEPVEEPVPQGDGSFSEASNRNFRCSCGGTTRVTKSDWKKYQSGETLELACPKCGAVGQVRREEAGEQGPAGKGLDLSSLAGWAKK